jgi:hypothetical protein
MSGAIGMDDAILLFTMGIAAISVALKARNIVRNRQDSHNWLRLFAIVGCGWAIWICINALPRTLGNPTEATGIIASLPPFLILVTLEAAHSLDRW